MKFWIDLDGQSGRGRGLGCLDGLYLGETRVCLGLICRESESASKSGVGGLSGGEIGYEIGLEMSGAACKYKDKVKVWTDKCKSRFCFY